MLAHIKKNKEGLINNAEFLTRLGLENSRSFSFCVGIKADVVSLMSLIG